MEAEPGLGDGAGLMARGGARRRRGGGRGGAWRWARVQDSKGAWPGAWSCNEGAGPDAAEAAGGAEGRDPGQRGAWPGAGTRAAAPRPRPRPRPSSSPEGRRRGAEGVGVGGGKQRSWGGGGGGGAGAFLSGTGRPGERGRRSAALFLPPSPPSLLAMSQSRHRAAAPPLEREDSGTFRSARAAGAALSGAGSGGRGGGAREPGSPAALWVEPPPTPHPASRRSRPRSCCGRTRWRSDPPSVAREPGSAAGPRPFGVLLGPGLGRRRWFGASRGMRSVSLVLRGCESALPSFRPSPR